MNTTLRMNAVGDVTVFHHEPEKQFEHVAAVLRDADLVFGQNERHYIRQERTSSVGFTEEVSAEHATVLKQGGFDVFSFASNHSMDLGADGMIETIETLKKLGFAVVGAGKNIQEARKPAYFERNGIKVAFLAYASVLRPNYEAGTEKAGVAPMRARTFYEQWDYQPGTAPHIFTYPYKNDLEALVLDVRAAKEQADVVVVSQHWGVHFAHAVIADYQIEVAHAAIDAGADLILGHHDHMPKGIEIYSGKPVFYGLGNFAFDLPATVVDGWIKGAPRHADALKEWGWAYGDPEWKMYSFPPECRRSMIVKFVIGKSGVERASILPVLINKKARPELVPSPSREFDEMFEYIVDISSKRKFNTKFAKEGNEIVVSLT